MLVRITYGNSWVDEDFLYHKEMFQKDPDVEDIFDISLLEQGRKLFFGRSCYFSKSCFLVVGARGPPSQN